MSLAPDCGLSRSIFPVVNIKEAAATRPFAMPRGFTMMETALAIIIVGTAFVATMSLFAACTRQNADSLRMTAAASLANNIRELMSHRSFKDPIAGFTQFGRGSAETTPNLFNDIDDFDGASFNPPIDAVNPLQPQPQPSLSGYTQLISVVPVDQFQFGATLPKTATSYGAVRITVTILYRATPAAQPRAVYTLNWVECAR